MSGEVTVHVSVLLQEVLDALRLERGGVFLDCTVGGAGHMEAILKASDQVRVVGIDRDKKALDRAAVRLKPYEGRFSLHHLSFSELETISELGPFDGIVADLGLSSDQIEDGRGISFREDAPLDMRMNLDDALTAHEVVNEYSAKELTRVLATGGVRKHLKRYVSTILSQRPFNSSDALADAIVQATPMKDRVGKHPATVVFQAIRIEVNAEFRQIEGLLNVAPKMIAPNGVFACISFHSLEDQIVARRMRKWRGEGAPANWAGAISQEQVSLGRMLTPKAITPSAEEEARNPRARSARLRVFEFTGGEKVVL